MNTRYALILSAALVLLAGCSTAPTAPPAPVQLGTVAATVSVLPHNIGVSEAARLRDAGAFILDVREPFEWDEIHIPGATLIPLDTLASRMSDVPRDKPIVVVCRSGNRSQHGRDILLNAGFTNVTSLDGGMRAWQTAGFPVTR